MRAIPAIAISLFLGGTAVAQEAPEDNTDPVVKPEPTAGDNDEPEGPADRFGGGKVRIDVGIAPRIVSDLPLASNDSTDDTKISWRLTWLPRVEGGNLTIYAGPSVTADSDGDSRRSTGFSIGANLRTAEPVWGGITPSFGYERSWTYRPGFFRGDPATEDQFNAGLTYLRKLSITDADGAAGRVRLEIELELGVGARRTESSALLGDYTSMLVTPALRFYLFSRQLEVRLSGEYERRLYDDLFPVINARRRDRHLQGFFGFNLAGAFNDYLARSRTQRIFHEVLLGVRRIDINSNVESEQNSQFRFVPAFSIRVLI